MSSRTPAARSSTRRQGTTNFTNTPHARSYSSVNIADQRRPSLSLGPTGLPGLAMWRESRRGPDGRTRVAQSRSGMWLVRREATPKAKKMTAPPASAVSTLCSVLASLRGFSHRTQHEALLGWVSSLIIYMLYR
eukprot:1192248-Prorocentrum_minimum.AAC.1